MPVYVSNMQDKRVIDADLEEVITRVVNAILDQSEFPGAEVSVVLGDNDYIRELNKQYREIDAATDVLSFAMLEGEEETIEDEDVLLGDIIISLERVDEQAKEYGHSFIRELAYLTAHGMFHLLGYDHNSEEERKIMREKEERVLAELGITR